MSAASASEARAGLRGLALRPGYDSGDRLLEAFYVPALSRAVRYDRSVGYFRSSSLAAATRGLTRFLNGGGTMRLLCGAELSAADRQALLGQGTFDGALGDRLAERLATETTWSPGACRSSPGWPGPAGWRCASRCPSTPADSPW